MIATVKRIDEKNVGVFVGKIEVGRTKLECDAQFNARIINEAHDHAVADAEQAANDEGYQNGSSDGHHEGYEEGYSTGHETGYEEGWQAGIDSVASGE